MEASDEILWRDYRSTRSSQCRDALMNRYVRLVYLQAKKIAFNIKVVQYEDLLAWGTMGLSQAIDHYRPTRGVKFETYSCGRIRGAILDGLREMDWVPRLVRSNDTKLMLARKALGDSASNSSIAAYLGLDTAKVDAMIAESDHVQMTSLNAITREFDHRDATVEGMLTDERSVDPLAYSAKMDTLKVVTKGMNKVERLIIISYYFLGMTMKEIGASVGLSESRISQMHSDIVLRWRHNKVVNAIYSR